jgi:phosphoribosylamine--glycine ligase
MKFLLYSQSGEGCQILKRISLEGNDCTCYIQDEAFETCFDGLLTKVKVPKPDKDTIVLFDMSGNGESADSWRNQGIKVYGASVFADKLEHDRAFGFETMQQAGIKIPEYEEFTDFSHGKQYVRSANKRLVFKPSGSLPTKLTYVPGKDRPEEELLAYMNFVEKQYKKYIKSFILQEFIEGVVVSSEAFCDGEKFLYPLNHTVEVKKSMNDDLGPSTGCSGNITWATDYNRITEEGISLAEAVCVSNQYVGQLDLNCVVNDTGVYGLEWTPRFGYDATPTLISLLNMDLAEFFSGIVLQQIKEINISGYYAGGVRVTIPPYPAEAKDDHDLDALAKASSGVPILNYEKFDEDLYFYEVCLVDADATASATLIHSGGSGVIACAMGQAEDEMDCLDNCYNALEELVIPDKQYRTDLHTVLPEMVQQVLTLAEGGKNATA